MCAVPTGSCGSCAGRPIRDGYVKSLRPPTGPPASRPRHTPFMLPMLGAFEKLPEQQEEIEWTRDAIGEDRRYLHLAYSAIAVDAVLLLVLGAMIFWHFYKK